MRIFAIILLFSACALAQTAASIGGRVIDHSGKPVAGATVQLFAGTGARHSAQSSSDGSYTLLGVDPGKYKIVVTAPQFYELTQEIALRPRQHVDLELMIHPLTMRHDEMTVHAMSSDIDAQQTSSEQFITRAEIEKLPEFAMHDVQSLARTLSPGAILSHDNFIHVRGNEMSLHEFINGVSFLDNSHQHFIPGLSPEIFETASVVTGGFSAEYGNRFGGVFDVTTRTGAQVGGHGELSAEAGSLMNGGFTGDYGGTYKKLGYYVFGNFTTTDRFLNTPQPEPLRDHADYGQGALQLDYAWTRDAVKLFVTGGADRFELPNDDDLQALGRDARRRLRSQSSILSWQHTFSDHAVLSTSAYERTVSDRVLPTTDPGTEFADASRATLTAGIKSDFSYGWRGHLFKAGVDLTRLRLLESLDFDPRDPASELPAFAFQEGRRGGVAAAYLQDKFSPLRNLTLDLGVRLDRYDMLDTHSAASPRAGIAYHIPQSHTVMHFAYSRLFSPPPIEYQLLTSYLGRSNPDPDKVAGNVRPYTQSFFDGGIEQQITEKTTAEISLYKFHGKNAFENGEVGISRVFAPKNFGKSSALGAEFVLNLRQWESRGWTARVQYGAQRAFFFGPFTGGLSEEPLVPGERILPAFDEIQTGSVLLTYANPRWRNFTWTSQMMYGSGTAAKDGAVRLPQHATGDFSLGFDAWQREAQRVTLEFNLQNVSNDRYQIAKESEEFPIQYAQGRTVSGRLRWRF